MLGCSLIGKYYFKAVEDVIREACISQDARTASLVAEDIFDTCDKYIDLQGQEIIELAGWATAHGWKSRRFEQGINCRNKIVTLKKKYLEVKR
jgi:hypothetical protein